MTPFDDPARHAQDICDALGGRQVPDGFMVRCPAHDDKNPSLHLTVTSDALLFKCHAGCEQERVLSSLRERRLWPEKASAAPAPSLSVDRTYVYHDEHGKPLHRTIRYQGKEWKQQHYAQGEWRWGIVGHVEPVLYRLPDLLKADPREPVWIVEGEKDADRLWSLGLVATTNAMGAGKWQEHYWRHLSGRRVVILPDNDEPGRKHARSVAENLSGRVSFLKVQELPGLASGQDVSDWLDAGHTKDELLSLAGATRDIPLETATTAQNIKDLIVTLRELLAKELPPARWAVADILPEGCALIIAPPKIGKTLLCQGLAIAIGSGGYAFGSIKVEQGDVLYLSLEDGEQLVQERCRQMLDRPDALDMVNFAFTWPRVNEGGLEAIEQWLIEHPNARAVFVDTLQMIRPMIPSTNVYQDDYKAVQGLHTIANKYHVAIVVIHHSRKMAAPDDRLDAASGSRGLTGAVDGALVMDVSRSEGEGTLAIIHKRAKYQELALTWDDMVLQWKLAGSAEDYSLSKERREIVQTIYDEGGSLSPSEVAKYLEKNYRAVKSLMRKMVADELLAPDERNKGKYKPGPKCPLPLSAKSRDPSAYLPQNDAKKWEHTGRDPAVLSRALRIVREYEEEEGSTAEHGGSTVGSTAKRADFWRNDAKVDPWDHEETDIAPDDENEE